MSLYNVVLGFHPLAQFCMWAIKLHPDAIPRFRDMWFTDDGQHVILLTRIGGGNRGDYVEENEKLRQVPGYVDDVDDEFDSTFARFRYVVPEEFRADAKIAAEFVSTTHIGGSDEQGPARMLRVMLDETVDKPVDEGAKALAGSALRRIAHAAGVIKAEGGVQ